MVALRDFRLMLHFRAGTRPAPTVLSMTNDQLPKSNYQLPTWLEVLAITAVLILAAVFRMGWPGLAEFKADEARLLALAWEMADGRAFPLRGISSSVGISNFPTSVWLYAVPLVVWGHVYSAVLWTGLLNTAAVGLTYWLVRRYWGWQAALVAAFMLAVSPWAIMHSRKIWAQNLLLPFVLGWGISAGLALVEQRQRWLIPMLVCAAVAVQIHLAAVSILLATAVLLLIFRQRVAWRWVGWGLGTAVVLVIPFLIHVVRQGTRGLVAFMEVTERSSAGGFSWQPILHTARLMTGWQLHALAGPSGYEAYLAQLPPILMPLIWVVWGLLAVLGLAYMGWLAWVGWGDASAVTRRTAEMSLLLLVWLGAAVATFIWFPTPVELHYLLPIYPVPYVAAGVLLAWLWPWLRWRGGAFVVASGAGQLWAVWLLLGFVGQVGTPGGYGSPISAYVYAAETAEKWLAETSATEVIIAGTGDDPARDEFAAVFGVLLRDVPHRFVNIQQAALFPEGAAVVLLHPAPAPLMDLYATAATAERTIPLRPGEGFLMVVTLPAHSAPTPASPFVPLRWLSNGVNFMGVDAPRPNGDFRLYWEVGEPRADGRYYFLNHVQDALGNELAQTDVPALAMSQWRPGDVVVSRFVLQDLEKGVRPLTIRTGMYHFPSLEQIYLLDENAAPYEDAAETIVPLD